MDNNIPNRELTRIERAEIRNLVVGMCANYDYEYGCLPLDCACYMLGKRYTGAYCRYFKSSVLPLNPALENAIMSRFVISDKKCDICGKPFLPSGRQKYCSVSCIEEGNRRTSRERMKKLRLKTK